MQLITCILPFFGFWTTNSATIITRLGEIIMVHFYIYSNWMTEITIKNAQTVFCAIKRNLHTLQFIIYKYSMITKKYPKMPFQGVWSKMIYAISILFVVWPCVWPRRASVSHWVSLKVGNWWRQCTDQGWWPVGYRGLQSRQF